MKAPKEHYHTQYARELVAALEIAPWQEREAHGYNGQKIKLVKEISHDISYRFRMPARLAVFHASKLYNHNEIEVEGDKSFSTEWFKCEGASRQGNSFSLELITPRKQQTADQMFARMTEYFEALAATLDSFRFAYDKEGELYYSTAYPEAATSMDYIVFRNLHRTFGEWLKHDKPEESLRLLVDPPPYESTSEELWNRLFYQQEKEPGREYRIAIIGEHAIRNAFGNTGFGFPEVVASQKSGYANWLEEERQKALSEKRKL